MKLGYFVKTLPSGHQTFIHHEVAWLRLRGNDVYLMPIWDIDPADLPNTAREHAPYNYTRFSLIYPGWICALAYFSLTNPAMTARIFSDYRRTLGLKFVLKSLEAARFLKKAGIERIHAHTLSLAASRARICSLLLAIPYVVTVHGSDLLLFPPADADRLIQDAAFVITPTNYNKTRITALAAGARRDKIRVIPCPVDTDFFRPSLAEGKGKKTARLITVARLHPIKGHAFIIRAAELLRQQNLDFSLTIVGGGELELPLRRLVAELDLEDRIEFTGALADKELGGRLVACDVFVMASRSEGLPVAMLEAMASGLAVVVPAITGIPEVVKHGINGLLVRPEDSADLAEKLSSVISDESLRERLGREARQTALLQFNRDMIYTKIFNLIGGSGQQ